MKLGLHMATMEWHGGPAELGNTMGRVVETAEEAGFDTITVADHVWQHPIMGGPIKNQVEAYTTLGFIAARTRRVRLLALATAAPYRPAGLLAKMVTTLDVLSGGRMMLGIGAGDYPEEAEGLGLAYPSLRERFEIVEETVQACLRMWDGEHGDERPFEGEHVRLGRALNVPQSLQRPHPPILIAGSGEKRTLPSSPATPTPATSNPRLRSLVSSSCSAGYATRSGAITTRSRRRPRSASMSAKTAPGRARSSTACAGWPGWASSRSSAGSSGSTKSGRSKSWPVRSSRRPPSYSLISATRR